MFSQLPEEKQDPIMALMQDYLSNTNPKKVNLGIGLYYDAMGKIPLLPSVDAAQIELGDAKNPHTYPPIEGLPEFTAKAQALLFGKTDSRIATIQTLGGSGALTLGASFLHDLFPKSDVWVSDPTWPNHLPIFRGNGLTVDFYPYYNESNGQLRLDDMLQFFKQLPENSIVLLHACCHNPTGVDLNQSQWLKVIDVLKAQKLIPFIDIAYQGFGDGLEEDVFLIRELAKTDITFLVSQSFSKNFALYGQRIGTLSVVCPNETQAELVKGQLKSLVRASYSCPPIQGANVVGKILSSDVLNQNWVGEVNEMRARILKMRALLSKGLADHPSLDAACFINQKGMFSYTGLNDQQLARLREEYAIYLVSPGRMCVAGLNLGNIDYVIDALKAVTR